MLWVLTALILLFSMAVIASLSSIPPVRPSPVWTIAFTAALVWLDLRRRKELVLLHNLGVQTFAAVGVGTIPAVVGELVALTLSS